MSDQSASLPPAGWHPDPMTPGQLRYWDGAAWTEHTHPEASESLASEIPPATTHSSANSGGAAGSGTKRGWLSSTRSHVIAGAVAGALVLATGGTVWALNALGGGGERSPEAAVAKTAEAIQNLDVHAFMNSIAPSEASHFRPAIERSLSILESRGDSGERSGDNAGSASAPISIEISDVETETTPVIEGKVERVTLKRGKITVDGRLSDIARALASAGPDSALLRVVVYEGGYGPSSIFDGIYDEDRMPESLDETIDDIGYRSRLALNEVDADEALELITRYLESEVTLPWRVDVRDLADETWSDELALMTVHESGGWYVSPLLTAADLEQTPDAVAMNPEIPGAAESKSPEDMVRQMLYAGSGPNDPELGPGLSFLSLAERRVVALYPSAQGRVVDYYLWEAWENVQPDGYDTDRHFGNPDDVVFDSDLTVEINGDTAFLIRPANKYAGFGAPEDFPIVLIREGGTWVFSPLATYAKTLDSYSQIIEGVVNHVTE